MFESRYSKILTIILIIIIVAIVGLLMFLGYDYYQKYFVTQQASNFVENFNSNIIFNETNNDNTIVEENTNTNSNTEITNNIVINGLNETPTVGGNSSSNLSDKKCNGYTVAGTIVIPTINVNYPILEEMSTGALQQAIVLLYPTAQDLNKPGNVVLVGHNYRNGLFFSNVKKLKNGDKIYITDNSGVRKEYTVYNKFEASDTDTSFYQRDTNGVAEITLSTCTDANNDQRTIVFAKAAN